MASSCSSRRVGIATPKVLLEDPTEWDQNTAKYYGDYLSEFISARDPPFVIFWNLQDRWQSGKRMQGLRENSFAPRLNYRAAINALQQPVPCS
jgi:hypothetical protein